MSEHGSQDKQEPDARVLGRVLAAQNVLLVLPNAERVAEFFAQTLQSFPGVRGCRVCLDGGSVQAGDMPACNGSDACRGRRWDAGSDIATDKQMPCKLADSPDVRVMAVRSFDHHWGHFAMQVEHAQRLAVYEPFLQNLASYVALALENRGQRRLLEAAQYDLERKVAERTRDLTRTNEALQREIAERGHAEKRARQMSDRLQLAAQAAGLGVWDWDLRTNAIVWDERMYDLCGVDRAADPAEAGWRCMHPDDKPAMETLVERAPREGGTWISELRVVWPDGTVRALELYAQVVRDEDGRPQRMAGIAFDITERKRAAEEVLRLNRELEQRVAERTAELSAANKELESFVYSVSHDLRAPIRHMSGFLALLQQKLPSGFDQQGQRYLSVVVEANQRMGHLIDDLLSFSRMSRQELSKHPVDLAAVIRDVIRELEPDVRGRTIAWEIADLPPVTGDASLLRSVFSNLLSNAVKFTRPKSSARITIGRAASEANEVVFFVRDNGVGFDPSYTSKLFGVFQRLHRAEEFEGTGVGLANVRRIVERHGGRTWAEGRVDEGATFYVALPR